MPIEDEGNPTNWILRFKHGRITILMFTEPLTPFLTLKTDLLDLIRERYPTGLPTPTEDLPIPEDPDDLVLGVQVDDSDAAKGWQELMLANGGAGARDSPKNLGLSDGSVVAFRFMDEEDFEVIFPTYEETYGEGAEVDEDMDTEREGNA